MNKNKSLFLSAILATTTITSLYGMQINSTSVDLNKKFTIKLLKPVTVQSLLKLIFPGYSILVEDGDLTVLNNVLPKISYDNIKLKYIIKNLEYILNKYLVIEPKSHIILVKNFKILKYYLPVNGNIKTSSKVVLGTGGGSFSSNKNLTVSNGTLSTKNNYINSGNMASPTNKGGNVNAAGGQNLGGVSGSPDTLGVSIGLNDNETYELINILKNTITKKEKLYFDVKTGLLQLVVGPRSEAKVRDIIEPIIKNRKIQLKVSLKVIEFQRTKGSSIGVSWSKFWNDVLSGVNLNVALKMLSASVTEQGKFISNQSDTNLIPFGVGVKSTGTTKINGTDVPNAQAFISMLKTFGDVKIVSEPSIILRNGETVIVNSGEKLTYVKEVSKETDQNGNETYTVTPGSLLNGFRLLLNATLDPKTNEVSLFLAPILQNTVDIKTFATQNVQIQLPDTNVKSISLFTRMPVDSTIVLGGLKTGKEFKNTTGIPLLSDIPLIGNLFKYKREAGIEKQVIFVVHVEKVEK